MNAFALFISLSSIVARDGNEENRKEDKKEGRLERRSSL